jgi:hypothetical protein
MPPPKRIDTEARIARSIPRKLQEQIWVIQSPARTLRIGESRLTRNDQTFIFLRFSVDAPCDPCLRVDALQVAALEKKLAGCKGDSYVGGLKHSP